MKLKTYKILPVPARALSVVMGVLVINTALWSSLLTDPASLVFLNAKMITCNLDPADPLTCTESDVTEITP